MFRSVLIANRAEIAVRVMRTLQRLGVRSVAVFSDADADAPHVRMADAAVRIGPAPAAESYLRADAMIDAARRSGAEAVHPGYGFLSERPDFARACADAGLTFVGPPPKAMRRLGDKVQAKQLAIQAGVPTVPGIERADLDDEEIAAWASEDPGRYPLMVKAAAGGGGRGMRVVTGPEALHEALAAARREAFAAFGDGAMLAERYLPRARHIEVQLLADAHGGIVHLGERECSLQRRHQKLVEECPSPAVDPELRARLGAAAVALARAAGYVGAGTAEFLVPFDDPAAFYFLELNARLQVEHPVTELVYGLDLVEAQLRIAAGQSLWFAQDDVRPQGHAIEARVCAEDPDRGFMPAAARIVAYREPRGPGVRVDSGVERGTEVTTHYDSMLAKAIVHADDRETALDRLDGALAHFAVLGPATNIAFLRRLLALDDVRSGALDTALVGRMGPAPPHPEAERQAPAAVALARTLELHARASSGSPWDRLVSWRPEGPAPLRYELEPAAGGEPVVVTVTADGDAWRVRVGDGDELRASAALNEESALLAVELGGERQVWAHGRDGEATLVGAGGRVWAFRERTIVLRGDAGRGGASLQAPMPGNVLFVHVAEGDPVLQGDALVVLESMKMELQIVAPDAGVVANVAVGPGDRVQRGQTLVAIATAPSTDERRAATPMSADEQRG